MDQKTLDAAFVEVTRYSETEYVRDIGQAVEKSLTLVRLGVEIFTAALGTLGEPSMAIPASIATAFQYGIAAGMKIKEAEYQAIIDSMLPKLGEEN